MAGVRLLGEAVDASLAQLVEESYALELAGDVAAAMERAQQALEMAVASDDPSAKALALTVVAFIYFRQGRYATARLLALEALAQAGPETAAAADALLVLGMCASETDNLVDAEECYRRAIDLGRQLGYHRVVIRGLHNLSAGVYMPRGQFALSLASDEEALRLALAKGLTEYIPIPLIVIAWVHWLTGQRAQAHAALEELGRRAAPRIMIAGPAPARNSLRLSIGCPVYANRRGGATAAAAGSSAGGDVLRGRLVALQSRHPVFPFLAQLLAALKHISLGFLEVLEHAAALDQIARPAGGHQIMRVLLASPRTRHNEVHAHHQIVLEAGGPVQAAVLATIMVTLEDVQALFKGQRLRTANELDELGYRHWAPPAN